MKLTVLGTSTPYPRPNRPCSGYLLESATTAIWIDAGPGTLAELLRIHPLATLDAIWVSHRHVDHSADLLSAYYALRYGVDGPASVPLLAPAGLRERIADYVGPAAESKVDAAFPPVAVSGFGETRIGDLSLSWAPVQHGVPAFAVRVEDGTSSFVYSGDCAPCTSLTELAEDADTLLCECGYETDPSGSAAEPPSVPVHHTPEDAGHTADEARVGRLMLTHLGAGLTARRASRRANAVFDGPVVPVMPRAEYEV